ncbi:MAG: RpiB/LacA/LacB family sugar-phosphate isomerase, partial [Oscillospiraceae bacterium]
MKIAIGCDHVGFEIKGKVISHLREKGIEVVDFGTNSTERTDYPIYGEAVARAVAGKDCDKGILICGTGVGISLA